MTQAVQKPEPIDEEASDVEVLTRCANGESDALLVLYRRHTPRLYRYLARWMGFRTADAEDALQKVFVVVWHRAGSFRPRSGHEGEVLAWLFGIATNIVREQRRADRNRLRAIQRLGELALPISPALDEQIGHRRLAQRAIDALEELSDPLREAYLLCDVEGWSGMEAAFALKVRPGTLRRRLHQARKKLRARLAEGEDL